MHTKSDLHKGTMLLAEPFMMDFGFKRSALLLCDHGVEGSVGFILNKPIDMEVDSLLADFPATNLPVFYGGPVATDTLHYLHNMGEILDESIEVGQGIFWGGNFSQLKALIRQGVTSNYLLRFFVGYSGWSAGQLSDELDYGSWVLADFDPGYLTLQDPTHLWKLIMSSKGSTFDIISEIPDDTHWN